MRDILKHFDIVSEADTQIKNLAQQLDSLVDNLDSTEQSPDEPAKPKKSRDNINVYGRKRQS
jgi:hypothetical protein